MRRGPKGLRETSLLIALAILSIAVLSGLATPARGATLTVHLKDTLSFDPAMIAVAPGEQVNLTLINDGIVEHTFTLFADADAAVPLNDNTALMDYNQTHEKIVDVFLEPGQVTNVTFKAPTQPGTYIFVCMIPLHAVGGMHGVLVVGGSSPGPGFSLGIGLVQALMLLALAGTALFAIIYHIRSTRSGRE